VYPSMAEKLKGYAREAGVSPSAYLRRLIQDDMQARGRWSPEMEKDRGGFVYLLRCCGSYKIGRTVNSVNDRAFSMSLPEKPEVVAFVRSVEYIQLEKDLHAAYAEKRGYGEWFRLDDADVEAIKAVMREKDQAPA
jgi:hypothetical protein